jgi:hypothetical protein
MSFADLEFADHVPILIKTFAVNICRLQKPEVNEEFI